MFYQKTKKRNQFFCSLFMVYLLTFTFFVSLSNVKPLFSEDLKIILDTATVRHSLGADSIGTKMFQEFQNGMTLLNRGNKTLAKQYFLNLSHYENRTPNPIRYLAYYYYQTKQAAEATRNVSLIRYNDPLGIKIRGGLALRRKDGKEAYRIFSDLLDHGVSGKDIKKGQQIGARLWRKKIAAQLENTRPKEMKNPYQRDQAIQSLRHWKELNEILGDTNFQTPSKWAWLEIISYMKKFPKNQKKDKNINFFKILQKNKRLSSEPIFFQYTMSLAMTMAKIEFGAHPQKSQKFLDYIFQQDQKKVPDNIREQAHLIQRNIFFKAGHSSKALTEDQKILEINPSNQAAKERIRKAWWWSFFLYIGIFILLVGGIGGGGYMTRGIWIPRLLEKGGLHIGLYYAKKRKDKEACKFLTPLLERGLLPPEGKLALGLAFMHAKKFQEALPLLYESLESNPNDLYLLKAIAKSLDHTGQTQSAYDYYAACCERERRKSEQYTLHEKAGELAKQLKNWERGIHHDLEKLKNRPNQIDILRDLAKSYVNIQRNDLANEMLKKMLTLDPKLLTEILKEYQEIFQTTANEESVHNILAEHYFEEGNFEKSAVEYQLLLENNPSSIPYLEKLSLIYGKLLRETDQIEILRKILEINPDSVHHSNALANQLVHTGEKEEALKIYERLLLQNNNDYDAYQKILFVGTELHGEGKSEIIVPVLQHAIDSAPFQHTQIRLLLGKCLAAMERLDDAIACAQQVVQADLPTKMEITSFTADCWRKKGHPQVGIEHLQTLGDIAMAPARETIKNQCHYILARCYEDLGRKSEAIRSYQHILQNNIYFSDASNRMEMLIQGKAEKGTAMEKLIECSKCKHPNPKGTIYCGQCGEVMEKDCPQCHISLPSTSHFCSSCGFQFS